MKTCSYLNRVYKLIYLVGYQHVPAGWWLDWWCLIGFFKADRFFTSFCSRCRKRICRKRIKTCWVSHWKTCVAAWKSSELRMAVRKDTHQIASHASFTRARMTVAGKAGRWAGVYRLHRQSSSSRICFFVSSQFVHRQCMRVLPLVQQTGAGKLLCRTLVLQLFHCPDGFLVSFLSVALLCFTNNTHGALIKSSPVEKNCDDHVTTMWPRKNLWTTRKASAEGTRSSWKIERGLVLAAKPAAEITPLQVLALAVSTCRDVFWCFFGKDFNLLFRPGSTGRKQKWDCSSWTADAVPLRW